MRLSLSILADWLKKYDPVCSIISGERTIRNVRIFSDEHHFTDNNVYVSTVGGDSRHVICMHKNDYITLNADDENQVMNEIMDAFDYYNDWADSLNRDLPAMDLDQLLKACTSVIGTPLTLTDASYSILSYYCPQGQENDEANEIWNRGIMKVEQIMNVEQDQRIRERLNKCYILKPSEFKQNFSIRNLFTDGRHWGWLISTALSEHTRGQMDIQAELGDILEHWMSLHREQQIWWEQTGVFLSLLDGNYSSREHALFQLGLIGWQKEEEKWLYVVSETNKAKALIHKVAKLSNGVQTLIYKEKLTAIFHGTKLERQLFERSLEHLLKVSGCKCGISPAFSDFFNLGEQYALACAASQYQNATLCPFEDIAMDHALTILKENTGNWFIHPTLTKLRQYDTDNHTCFFDTLKEYLHQERSLAQTAATMNIHRNTLLYRINRIQEITNLNLDDPKIRLHLLISFVMEDSEKKQ